MSFAPSRGRRRSRGSGSLSSTFGDAPRRAHGESTGSVPYALVNVALLVTGVLFALTGVFITLVTVEPLIAALFLLSIAGAAAIAAGSYRARHRQTRSRRSRSTAERLADFVSNLRGDAPDRL